MSDSVVKIRIDSKEYDANIKRAGDALTQYFQKVREGGGTLKYLDEGVMEAVKAMGELGTKADNTKGALRELTQTTTDMTIAYRSLTDEEKNSPLGAAMAQSISQMTERAGEMRDAMADVQASINNAASDTRTFDQIAGAANLATNSFQALQGAGKLLGIEIGDNVEVIAKLQAAMAVTNGLTQIQTTLQKQSALMQGVQAVQAAAAAAAQTTFAGATGAATIAQKAFNVVANMNPYVLLATTVVAAATAIYAFASASSKAEKEAEDLAKAEEEAAKRAEDARNAYINASAEAMNSASRLSSLQVAYKNANSEMEKTNILQQAQAEFKKLGIECKGLEDAQTLLISKGAEIIELIKTQGNVAALSAVRMEKFKESFSMLMENGYSASAAASLAGYNKDVQELDNQITTMQSRIQNLKGGLGTSSGGSGGGGPKGSTKNDTKDIFDADSVMAYERQIANLEDQYKRAGESLRQFLLPQLENYKQKLAEIKGGNQGDKAPEMATGTSGFNEQNINAWISMMKEDLSKADFGSDIYKSITDNLSDMSQLTTSVQDAIKLGIDIPQEAVQEMFEQVFDGGNLPEDMYNDMIQKFIADFKEKTGKDLEIGEGGKITVSSKGKEEKEDKQGKSIVEGIGQLTGGMNTMVSSMEQLGIKIPSGLKDVLGGIQSVCTLLSTISTIVTAIEAISAADMFIPFASGGIVGRAASGLLVGNNMSGDNLRMPVLGGSGGMIGINDGELILNKAQQGIIADSLQGSGLENLNLETIITAEDLIVMLNNNANRRGMEPFIKD